MCRWGGIATGRFYFLPFCGTSRAGAPGAGTPGVRWAPFPSRVVVAVRGTAGAGRRTGTAQLPGAAECTGPRWPDLPCFCSRRGSRNFYLGAPRPPTLGGAQRGWAPRSAGRDKSPENSPAATADRRPTAKKVRKLQAYGHTAQLPKGFPRRGICPPVRPGHLTVWPGSQKVWPGRLAVWAADDLRNTMEGGRQ